MFRTPKADFKLLNEGLHSELLQPNVKVTLIFPGAIDTNIAANSGVGIRQASAENTACPAALWNAGGVWVRLHRLNSAPCERMYNWQERNPLGENPIDVQGDCQN